MWTILTPQIWNKSLNSEFVCRDGLVQIILKNDQNLIYLEATCTKNIEYFNKSVAV